MTMAALKILSEKKLLDLWENISVNRDRYEAGEFLDLEHENGWAIETATVQVDYSLLKALDGTERTAAADIENSLIIYRALHGMTPAIAREERVWVRLTHIECLEYTRARWLSGKTGVALDSSVETHFFAKGLTAIRDDNALSRLWWNMHIASIADPDDPEDALRLILKTSDIRTNFVERTNTVARKPLARAVIRAMRRDPWIVSSERSFREFMISLNRDGGGMLFEALSEAESDALMVACALRAREHLK